METDWVLIIVVGVVILSIIVFLIWRNRKDEKDMMKNLIEQDEASIPKEPDTEIDEAD
ncbi:MAG: hypothetical protein WCR72_10600 [Bacteroidota bacterium]